MKQITVSTPGKRYLAVYGRGLVQKIGAALSTLGPATGVYDFYTVKFATGVFQTNISIVPLGATNATGDLDVKLTLMHPLQNLHVPDERGRRDDGNQHIDVEAKAGIHYMIRALTREGIAVLMISSELPEILGMGDRVLFMRDGRIGGELPARSTEQDIMLMATGHTNGQDAENHAPIGKE